MREQRARKRASRLYDYQCDSHQGSAGASNKRTTAARAGRPKGNNAALLFNKAMTDEQYQEAAAAALRKRNKQIEDACLGHGSGGLVYLEPMPRPPSERAALKFYASQGFDVADALAPEEDGQHQHRQQQQQQQQQRQQQAQSDRELLARLQAQLAELERQQLGGLLAPIPLPYGRVHDAAAAEPSTQLLSITEQDNLQPEAAGAPASVGGGLRLPVGSSQQQQQHEQDWQKVSQHARETLQEVDAALAAAAGLGPEQQLQRTEYMLQKRQQVLRLWQLFCATNNQQPMPAGLQRLLQQQHELQRLVELLPLTEGQHDFKRRVLDRQQRMLEQWQQLQGDLQEQQRLLAQQNRALDRAAAIQQMFSGDPFAFLNDNRQPSAVQKPLSKFDLCVGWMEVLRKDAEQQGQPAQPASGSHATTDDGAAAAAAPV